MDALRKNAKWIGLAGCVIMIVACFLPFATVSMMGLSQTVSLFGTGALGKILIACAVISGLVMLTKKAKLSLITTIIYLLLLLLNIMNASDYQDTFSYGAGLYVAIIGIVIAIVMPFFIKKVKK